jgi:hypothetical protein
MEKIMKDYNIMALQGMDMTDEETAGNVKTFPKELIHTADMNLWLTWYYHLTNVEADSNQDNVKKGLLEQLDRMRIIIPQRYWCEMEISHNDPLHMDFDPEWYLNDNKLISACINCYEEHPHTYLGHIQDDNGFELTFKLEGKWKLNPSDEFWKTEESMEAYCRLYYNRSAYTPEESFDYLIEQFGEDNLPPWADQIKNAD